MNEFDSDLPELTPIERAQLQLQRDNEAYQQEMERLNQAGSDPRGEGAWRAAMRRIERRN